MSINVIGTLLNPNPDTWEVRDTEYDSFRDFVRDMLGTLSNGTREAVFQTFFENTFEGSEANSAIRVQTSVDGGGHGRDVPITAFFGFLTLARDQIRAQGVDPRYASRQTWNQAFRQVTQQSLGQGVLLLADHRNIAADNFHGAFFVLGVPVVNQLRVRNARVSNQDLRRLAFSGLLANGLSPLPGNLSRALDVLVRSKEQVAQILESHPNCRVSFGRATFKTADEVVAFYQDLGCVFWCFELYYNPNQLMSFVRDTLKLKQVPGDLKYATGNNHANGLPFPSRMRSACPTVQRNGTRANFNRLCEYMYRDMHGMTSQQASVMEPDGYKSEVTLVDLQCLVECWNLVVLIVTPMNFRAVVRALECIKEKARDFASDREGLDVVQDTELAEEIARDREDDLSDAPKKYEAFALLSRANGGDTNGRYSHICLMLHGVHLSTKHVEPVMCYPFAVAALRNKWKWVVPNVVMAAYPHRSLEQERAAEEDVQFVVPDPVQKLMYQHMVNKISPLKCKNRTAGTLRVISTVESFQAFLVELRRKLMMVIRDLVDLRDQHIRVAEENSRAYTRRVDQLRAMRVIDANYMQTYYRLMTLFNHEIGKHVVIKSSLFADAEFVNVILNFPGVDLNKYAQYIERATHVNFANVMAFFLAHIINEGGIFSDMQGFVRMDEFTPRINVENLLLDSLGFFKNDQEEYMENGVTQATRGFNRIESFCLSFQYQYSFGSEGLPRPMPIYFRSQADTMYTGARNVMCFDERLIRSNPTVNQRDLDPGAGCEVNELMVLVGSAQNGLPFSAAYDKMIHTLCNENADNPSYVIAGEDGQDAPMPNPQVYEKFPYWVYLDSLLKHNLFAQALKEEEFTGEFTRRLFGRGKVFFDWVMNKFAVVPNPAIEKADFLFRRLREPVVPRFTCQERFKHTLTGHEVPALCDAPRDRDLCLLDCRSQYMNILCGGYNRIMPSDMFGHTAMFGGMENPDIGYIWSGYKDAMDESCLCDTRDFGAGEVTYHSVDCLRNHGHLELPLVSYMADFGNVYIDGSKFDMRYAGMLKGLLDPGTTWYDIQRKQKRRFVSVSLLLGTCYRAFLSWTRDNDAEIGVLGEDGFVLNSPEMYELLRFFWHVQHELLGLRYCEFDFTQGVRLALRRWLMFPKTLTSNPFAEEVNEALAKRFVLPSSNRGYVQVRPDYPDAGGTLVGVKIGTGVFRMAANLMLDEKLLEAEQEAERMQDTWAYAVHKMYKSLPAELAEDNGVGNQGIQGQLPPPREKITGMSYVNSMIRRFIGQTKYAIPQGIYSRQETDLLRVDPQSFREDGTVITEDVCATMNSQMVTLMKYQLDVNDGYSWARGTIRESGTPSFHHFVGSLPMVDTLLMSACCIQGVLARGTPSALRTMVMELGAMLMNILAQEVPVIRVRTDSVLMEPAFAESAMSLLKSQLWNETELERAQVDLTEPNISELSMRAAETTWVFKSPLRSCDLRLLRDDTRDDFSLPGVGMCYSALDIRMGDPGSLESDKARKMSETIQREAEFIKSLTESQRGVAQREQGESGPVEGEDESPLTTLVTMAGKQMVHLRDSRLFYMWVRGPTVWPRVTRVVSELQHMLDFTLADLEEGTGLDIHEKLGRYINQSESVASLYAEYTGFAAYYVLYHIGPCVIKGEPGSGKSTRVKEIVKQLCNSLCEKEVEDVLLFYQARGVNSVEQVDGQLAQFSQDAGVDRMRDAFRSDGLSGASPGGASNRVGRILSHAKGMQPRDLTPGAVYDPYVPSTVAGAAKYRIAIVSSMHAPLSGYRELGTHPMVFVGTIHALLGVNLEVGTRYRNPAQTLMLHHQLRPEFREVKYIFVDEAEMMAKEFEEFLKYLCDTRGVQVFIIGDDYQTAYAYGRGFSLDGAVAKYLSRSISFVHDMQFRSTGSGVSRAMDEILRTGDLCKYFTEFGTVPLTRPPIHRDPHGNIAMLYRTLDQIYFVGMHNVPGVANGKARMAQVKKQDEKDDAVYQLDAQIWRIVLFIVHGKEPDTVVCCQNWKMVALVWLEVERRIAFVQSKYLQNMRQPDTILLYRTHNVPKDMLKFNPSTELSVKNLSVFSEGDRDGIGQLNQAARFGAWPAPKKIIKYMKEFSKGRVYLDDGHRIQGITRNSDSVSNGPEGRKMLHGLCLRLRKGTKVICTQQFRTQIVPPKSRVMAEDGLVRAPCPETSNVGMCSAMNIGQRSHLTQMARYEFVGSEKWVLCMENPLHIAKPEQVAELCRVFGRNQREFGNSKYVKDVCLVLTFRCCATGELVYLTEMEVSRYLMPDYAVLGTFIIGQTVDKIAIMQVNRRKGDYGFTFTDGYESLQHHAKMLSNTLGNCSTSAEFARLLRVYFTRVKSRSDVSAYDINVASHTFWKAHFFNNKDLHMLDASQSGLTMEYPGLHTGLGTPVLNRSPSAKVAAGGEADQFGRAYMSVVMSEANVLYALPFYSSVGVDVNDVQSVASKARSRSVVKVDGYFMDYSSRAAFDRQNCGDSHALAFKHLSQLTTDARLVHAYKNGLNEQLYSFPLSHKFAQLNPTLLGKLLYHPRVYLHHTHQFNLFPTQAITDCARDMELLDLEERAARGGGNSQETVLVGDLDTPPETNARKRHRMEQEEEDEEKEVLEVTDTKRNRGLSVEDEASATIIEYNRAQAADCIRNANVRIGQWLGGGRNCEHREEMLRAWEGAQSRHGRISGWAEMCKGGHICSGGTFAVASRSVIALSLLKQYVATIEQLLQSCNNADGCGCLSTNRT